MKTLEELQKEYAAERKAYEKIKAEHVAKCEEIKAAVIALAKYKVGDKVVYVGGSSWIHEKNIPGIIRSVHAIQRYGDELSPCYRVAKVTKSGAPHASQDIGYSQIDEKMLIPFVESADGH